MTPGDEKVESLINEFKTLSDWEKKYVRLIELGKDLENYPEKFRLDAFKVKGCQSQVWLYPELRENIIHFYADSDASIVKGLVATLLAVYNDRRPDEILLIKPAFLDEIGLRENLSMSRANGLNSMLKQVSLYALAFSAKLSQESGE